MRDLEGFAALHNATDRQVEALQVYDEELLSTSAHTNLIARSTLEDRWSRHYHDSAQLLPLLPKAPYRLLDLGTGAGFPGMVLRILTMEEEGARYTFCDSVQKKAAFLSRVAEKAQLPLARIVPARAEQAFRDERFDVITARAVTNLTALLSLAAPLLATEGRLIAPKGRRAQVELDAASEDWSFDLERHDSKTDAEASILVLRNIEARP
ncbi:16S rRNA (guanine(527)-N(7))-methyltransferase RsmG [Parvularcula maris]|uniref:Ribosomal RNA small subunit methyltransferase G n=1 Tax=Parvularcula maris TaxID=2965077 RepID=A0A9X2RIP7_9PROT|nr:16S rRNA (guanine(527)-N(7))-methyltransferase RsmG [Parvularcula maris]MCQ8183813.1 16S rRNA (guanine(527)-N(7))-methyltransferase RsmG [Parvularcula maris]